MGINVQRERIRTSISRVDPIRDEQQWFLEERIQCQALTVYGILTAITV